MIRVFARSNSWLPLVIALSFFICSLSLLGSAEGRIAASSWEEDPEYLVQKLPEFHINLYQNIKDLLATDIPGKGREAIGQSSDL